MSANKTHCHPGAGRIPLRRPRVHSKPLAATLPFDRPSSSAMPIVFGGTGQHQLGGVHNFQIPVRATPPWRPCGIPACGSPSSIVCNRESGVLHAPAPGRQSRFPACPIEPRSSSHGDWWRTREISAWGEYPMGKHPIDFLKGVRLLSSHAKRNAFTQRRLRARVTAVPPANSH